MDIKSIRLGLAIGKEFTEYKRTLGYLKTCTDSSQCQEYYLLLKDLANQMISTVSDLCGESSAACSSLFHEISWETVENFVFNENIPGQEAIQEDYEATVNGNNKVVNPIWRPNTKYQVSFTLSDIIDDNSQDPELFKYNYGFKTAGPIGHYHNADNVDYGGQRDAENKLLNPELYPLTSLKQYIDFDRSYPNANGNLLRSKPLFYGNEYAKIQLFFKKAYTSHMFKKEWNAYKGLPEIKTPEGEDGNLLEAFKIFIQDPVSNVITPYPIPSDTITEEIPESIEQWNLDEERPISDSIRLIQKFAEANNGKCQFLGGDKIIPASEYITTTLRNLKPNKLYTAIITNQFNGDRKQIHSYAFQTSKFENFEQQVNSFIELNENNEVISKAIFNVVIEVTQEAVDSAFSLVNREQDSTNNVLETEFVNPFDRVVESIFKLPLLEPAQTTEFNIIKNASNEALAILIRNPEPFNDPKISEEELEKSIAVVFKSSSAINDTYKVLYSKDLSQALLMHENKIITANDLHIRFQFKNWNGSQYISESIIVEDITINN